MQVMRSLTEANTAEHPRIAFCLNGDGIVTLSGEARHRRVYAIDATELTIAKHIHAEEDITGEDVFIMSYLSYLYTLRLADTRKMRRLTKVSREVVTETKDKLFLSIDMVKYKIATMRCVAQKLTPANNLAIEQHFLDCGLRHEDATLYHVLYDNNDVQDFVKIMSTIEDKTFKLSVGSLSQELTKETISEFEKTANWFTRSKLRFIAHGNRFDYTDIQRDLFLRSIQAYYWVRPFFNQLHAVNYAKSSIRGYTQCLIEYYNKEDRRRTISTENGYDNVVRDITDEVFARIDRNEVEENMIEYLDQMSVYK